MNVLKKIVNIMIDIFIIIVVILSATVAVLSLTTDFNGVSNIMGYIPLAVQSDSMSPTFEEGDMIIGCQKDSDYEYKKGDIITFKMYLYDDDGNIVKNDDGTDKIVFNTHRIIKVEPPHDNIVETLYYTKGDNPKSVQDHDPVLKSNIIALWSTGEGENTKPVVCGPVSGIGSVMDYLRDPTGFALVVVLPMACFFIYELFRFINNLVEYNKEKSREAALEAARTVIADSTNGGSSSEGLSDEDKARIIEEYLAKQKSSKKDKQQK